MAIMAQTSLAAGVIQRNLVNYTTVKMHLATMDIPSSSENRTALHKATATQPVIIGAVDSAWPLATPSLSAFSTSAAIANWRTSTLF